MRPTATEVSIIQSHLTLAQEKIVDADHDSPHSTHVMLQLALGFIEVCQEAFETRGAGLRSKTKARVILESTLYSLQTITSSNSTIEHPSELLLAIEHLKDAISSS